MSDLTVREQELLTIIVSWYRTHDAESTIDTRSIMNRLGIAEPGVSNLKKRLIEKGLLRSGKGYRLTTTVIDDLANPRSAVRITAPVHLPVLGEVRAGRSKQDQLQVYITDLSSDAVETYPIPYAQDIPGTFILKVVGDSMEKERIFDGDYAIVQPFLPNVQPRQRELIITKYLPPRNEQEAKEASGFYTGLLEGPTIKYYTHIAGTLRPHRLSWRRDIKDSASTIDTMYIEPIGRVIGTYRSQEPI